MSTDVDIFLAHYGVKGMKWGVIRNKESSSLEKKPSEKKKLTPKQRKVLISVGAATIVGAGVATALLVNKSIRTKSVNDLLNEVAANDGAVKSVINGKNVADRILAGEDIYIPKGTTFHRVAGYMEQSVDAPKYATYIGQDVARYRRSWTTISGNGEDFFKTKFATVAGSKIASEDSTIRLAKELVNSPSIKGSKEFRDSITQWVGKSPYYKDLEMDELVTMFVKNNAGGDWKRGPAQHLFDYMTRNGYVGLTDTVDTGMIAKHAVVLFNNDIVKTTSSALTKSERATANRAIGKMFSLVASITEDLDE